MNRAAGWYIDAKDVEEKQVEEKGEGKRGITYEVSWIFILSYYCLLYFDLHKAH